MFIWDGVSWNQIGQDIDGEATNDFSGCSVSISDNGQIVAIGANDNDGTGTNGGHVRVFQYSNGIWIQMGLDIDSENPEDKSGLPISLSSDGSTLAISAYENDGVNGIQSGHVRIYKWNGMSWDQFSQDIDGEDAYDQSGTSVSLSGNGNIVAIGAPLNDDISLNSGHVRVYSLNPACNDLGCLDPLALNFDPNATISDSTCIYPIYGCTDPTACNYDAAANTNDGGCNYATSSTADITACDSYEWNGQVYSESGTFIFNGNGINPPNEFTFLGNYDNSSYFISDSPANSWFDAYSSCLNLGGNLVTFSSLDEYNYVSNLTNIQFWIGLVDEGYFNSNGDENSINGNYIWIDDNNFDFSSLPNNWGSPSSIYGSNEFCGQVETNNDLNEIYCESDWQHYILEVPFNLQNSNNCDSVAILNLTIHETLSIDDNTITSCYGENINLEINNENEWRWVTNEDTTIMYWNNGYPNLIGDFDIYYDDAT